MIYKDEKLAVIKAAREWAKVERRLREAAWYPINPPGWKEWISKESDRTEVELLIAVKKLEKAEASGREDLSPGSINYVPIDPYWPRAYDIRLSEITRAYIEKLYELSTKLEEIKAPPPGQIVTIHAPFHTIEFHPHRKPKCKECGK